MRKTIGLICVLALGLTAGAQQATTSAQPSAAAPASQPSQQSNAAGAKQPEDLAPPEHPITTEQVKELMELTGLTALQRQTIEQMMPTLRQAMPPYMPDDVFQDFQDRLLGGEMQALVVKSYQKHISTEDAEAMIAFYKTPAGRRSILLMPVLMRELQAEGAELGQETMEKVLEQHRSEIEAAKTKYEQQQPPTTPKN